MGAHQAQVYWRFVLKGACIATVMIFDWKVYPTLSETKTLSEINQMDENPLVWTQIDA